MAAEFHDFAILNDGVDPVQVLDVLSAPSGYCAA
jgi:hypothetical protein